MDQDLIIGVHAIQAALENPKRSNFELIMTDEGHKALAHTLHHKKNISQTVLKKHDFQHKLKQLYQKLDLEYHRVTGGGALLCSALEIKSPDFLYQICRTQKALKLVVLDGITDIHNAGAIIRTAGFYGVDIIVVGDKFSFAMTPSFFRIAAGAVESLSIVQATALPRIVGKIQQLGVTLFALSQHAQQLEITLPSPPKLGIVLGAEDRGISHALLRQCEKQLALKGGGGTTSLNVSVAAAIAMERLFQTI